MKANCRNANWGIALLVTGVSMAVAIPATARPHLSHGETIAHSAGPLEATWTGTPRVTSRQIGSSGAAGRPASLRCVWRVDLDIARHARRGADTSLHASTRAEGVYELSRPGWCGREATAFAGQVAARDNALHARLREHAASDTRALIAQADALAQGAAPAG